MPITCLGMPVKRGHHLDGDGVTQHLLFPFRTWNGLDLIQNMDTRMPAIHANRRIEAKRTCAKVDSKLI